jgi:hypothetical protein
LKKGDKVPVTIAGDVATQAVVESVDMDSRRATLVIPATRVVMALRVEIDSAPQVAAEPESNKQTIITGVDRVDNEGNIIEGASTGEPVASESATVGGNSEIAESGAVETPQPDATQTQTSESQQATQQPEPRAVVRETEPVVSVEQVSG